MKKYELTEDKKEIFGRTLCKIKALTDISAFGVRKGDLGGWIESEHNLSHDGNCWISDNAYVLGDACVYDNAHVYGDALITSNARIYDNAQVFGEAYVYGNARIYDNAQVFGDSYVYDNARVYDNAHVFGDAIASGDARIYGNAHVLGDAKITGNAQVFDVVFISDNVRISGNAKIKNQKDILYVSSVGSEDGNLTAYKNSDGTIQIIRGCFDGTLEEFEKAVKSKHKGKKYEKEYLALIDFIRCRFDV